ncbi:MAG TPA: hypothetical protein VGM56_32735 [Byssovorax sp.]
MQNRPIPTGGSEPTGIDVFATGDAANSVTGAAMGDSIAAALGWLKDRVKLTLNLSGSATLNGTPPIILPATTQTRQELGPDVFGGGFAGASNGLNDLFYEDAGTGGLLIWYLNLPDRQVLTAVTAYLVGKGDGGSVAPAVLPNVEVFAQPMTTGGAGVQLGTTATDPFTSHAAYTAYHALTVAGIGHTIDRTANRYIAILNGESGSHSGTGLQYWGVATTISRTSIQE